MVQALREDPHHITRRMRGQRAIRPATRCRDADDGNRRLLRRGQTRLWANTGLELQPGRLATGRQRQAQQNNTEEPEGQEQNPVPRSF